MLQPYLLYMHTLYYDTAWFSELLNGRNALHYVTDYGQAEVIKYLVGKGAKLDVSVLCLSPMRVCVCVCVCARVCVCIHP